MPPRKYPCYCAFHAFRFVPILLMVLSANLLSQSVPGPVPPPDDDDPLTRVEPERAYLHKALEQLIDFERTEEYFMEGGKIVSLFTRSWKSDEASMWSCDFLFFLSEAGREGYGVFKALRAVRSEMDSCGYASWNIEVCRELVLKTSYTGRPEGCFAGNMKILRAQKRALEAQAVCELFAELIPYYVLTSIQAPIEGDYTEDSPLEITFTFRNQAKPGQNRRITVEIGEDEAHSPAVKSVHAAWKGGEL